MSLVICALFAVSFAFGDTSVDPKKVDAAITHGKDYLYSKISNDNWNRTVDKFGDEATGQTALVIRALLAAGENHQDERIAKAIEYLKKTPDTGIYSLGIRCQLWSELPQTADIRTAFTRDVKALLAGAHDTGTDKGLYPRVVGGKDYNVRSSYYAVLGLWTAAQGGQEVPTNFWQTTETAWVNAQDPTGGWAFHGKATPKKPVTPGTTANGIAALFMTQDFLHADEAVIPRGNIRNAHIDKGMSWLTSNFDLIAKDARFKYDYPFSTLYAIQAAGSASGLRYFQGINWFEVGAERLLRLQTADGSWGGDITNDSISGTAFSVLFLARGREPIVMNKLQYDLAETGAGNWNERPRDVANIARWVGRQTERDLDWQIVDLKASQNDLHDSQILYIAGNQQLKFTPEQQTKLREFVEEGGLILGNSDGNADAFENSFKSLGAALFPQYEFRPLPVDHPIFASEQYPASKWKKKPSVLGLSNGARELMLILPDVDLSRAWQVRETGSKQELFELAANLFLYSVDKKETHNKGETYLVDLDSKIVTKKSVSVARLKYAGTWDPEPAGWTREAAMLNNRDKVAVKVTTVDPATDSLDNISIAHLTGTGKFKLSDSARTAIKKFVDGGGTLLVDAAGGSPQFIESADAELAAMFPTQATQLKNPLPETDPIYSIGKKKIEVSYRRFAIEKLGGDLKGPRLKGIKIEKRLAVIDSTEDLSVGLVGMPIDGIIGYSPATASEIVRSILLDHAK